MIRAGSTAVIILGPWYALALILGEGIVPLPHEVIIRTVILAPDLALHAARSLLRVSLAMAAALSCATPLGVLLGRSPAWDRVFSGASYLMYPIPKIALLPVLLLIFGTGDATRVVLLFLVLFFQMLLAARDGVREIPEAYFTSIRSLGGDWTGDLRYVIVPAILPRMLTSLRIGAATALAVLFFAETFFTEHGLGFFIMDSWMSLSYLDMYAGVLAISLLGFAIFFLLDRIEKRLSRWRD